MALLVGARDQEVGRARDECTAMGVECRDDLSLNTRGGETNGVPELCFRRDDVCERSHSSPPRGADFVESAAGLSLLLPGTV